MISTTHPLERATRYLLAPWEVDDDEPDARARRALYIGIGVSILVHLLLLFISLHQRTLDLGGPSSAVQGPLSVQLSRPSPPPPQAQAAEPEPTPKPKPRAQPPKRDSVIALPNPTPNSPVLPVEPPRPEPTPTPPDQSPPVDIMASVAAARARRRTQEENAAIENRAARGSGHEPSADEIALANIANNLKSSLGNGRPIRNGTSGVFDITQRGVRTATFTFRGWERDPRDSWHETYEVDAGLHGDVDLAIVRKMIELIRKYYPERDFNWESRRLGKVKSLSARVADNAQLEEFLLQDFFDTTGSKVGRR